MANFSEAELAALRSGNRSIVLMVWLGTDPNVRLALGIGNFAVGANIRDPGGAVYFGLGKLTNVPAFDQVLNLTADRIQLSLSARGSLIDPDLRGDLGSAIAQDAVAIKNKPADLGLMILGASWQPLGDVHWQRRGVIDYLTYNIETAADDDTAETHTVGLSVSSLATGRRRPPLRHWNDAEQRRYSLLVNPSQLAPDRFCERTSNMTEYSKVWPRF